MRPRVADARIGFFGAAYLGLHDRRRVIRSSTYVNRWRLEKKDRLGDVGAQAADRLLDRPSVPDKYRRAIGDGVLEWNKAFERIGYKDAIRVEIQPPTPISTRRTFATPPLLDDHGAQRIFRDRPSVVDPRTGEILDADIGIEATSFRALKSYGVGRFRSGRRHRVLRCAVLHYARKPRARGLRDSLFEARGEMTPRGPRPRRSSSRG